MPWEIKQCININLLVVFSYFHLFSWILVGVLDTELKSVHVAGTGDVDNRSSCPVEGRSWARC